MRFCASPSRGGQPPLASCPAEPRPGGRQPGPLEGLHVLVVEDDAQLRLLTGLMIERLGARAALAVNGGQALALAQERRPDLVVLDVVLPDLSAAQVRRGLPAAPILLVSGWRPHQQPEPFRGVEDLPLLAKPFRPDELRRELIGLLRRARPSGRR
jgi:two-component system phosphate regulon response regulator PhoB